MKKKNIYIEVAALRANAEFKNLIVLQYNATTVPVEKL